jgi:hypothetical protein
MLDMLELQLAAQGAIQFLDESNMVRILDKSKKTVSLTVYNPNSIDLGMLDFNSASKNYDKYFKIGYDLLSKPTVQYRRVMQANKPQWMIYH